MSVRLNSASARAAGLMVVATLFLGDLERVAVAQTQPSQAESLFQSGLDKMRKGDYAAACPDLSESYELEAMPGVLFTLAECEASWGKVATALKHYQLFVGTLSSLSPVRRQKFEERRHLALEQITSLGPSVPMLSISVANGAPAELVVKRDGTIVPESSYGVQTPVDPGELTITAERGDNTLWQRRVRVATQDRAIIVVPWPIESTLGAAASSGPPPREEAAADSGNGASQRSTEIQPDTTKTRYTAWKYVTAGVGGVGFSVAIVAGAIALGKKGSVSEQCKDYRCSQYGLSQANSGKQAARVSTVGFIVGLVGAAGFTGLLVFGGPTHEPTHAGNLHVTVSNTANSGEFLLAGSF